MQMVPEKKVVFDEDMRALCALPAMKELRGKTVFITGATGLIGQTLVMALMRFNEEASDHTATEKAAADKDIREDQTGIRDSAGKAARIHVVACVRSEEKARRLFGSLINEGLTLFVSDIEALPAGKLDFQVDYIIHAASQTSSRAFVEQPVETIFTAVDGTRRILEFARSNMVRCLIYISTMEVYGTPSDDHKIDEKHGTDLDTMQARSCYPESKRLCENLCVCWQKEYGVPVRVLRLTQTFGPGVRYDDGRVFAEFARCALEGRDIVLRTAGATCRSYLYTADAAAAIFTVMVYGEDGSAYNAANEETYCSILEMARMVAAECADGRIDVRIEAAADPSGLGYAPTLHMNLDTARLRALGWKPTRGLADSYRRMMSAMEKDAAGECIQK